MKKLMLLILALLILSGAASSEVISGATGERPKYDPHSLIVKFRPGIAVSPGGERFLAMDWVVFNSEGVRQLNDRFKVLRLKKVFTGPEPISPDLSGYYKLFFPHSVDIDDAMEKYKADPDVEDVEYEYIAYAAVIPTDTNFPNQWGLSNEGQSGGTPDADIDAVEAWDICRGTNEVVIAVVDGGVDTDHPDLASKLIIINGCNFIAGEDPNDPNPVPNGNDESVPPDTIDSGCEHGTHVSGIAAAITNNTTPNGSVAGVGWNCKIMPVKSLDDEGAGYYSDVENGIKFAADNGADVINLSLGGPFSSAMQSAIDYAYAKDCVIVAAAGNGSKTYPNGFDIDSIKQSPVCNDGGAGENKVLGVSATTHSDAKAWYSNFGSTYVDVSAPGGETSILTQGIYSSVFHDPAWGFNNWFYYKQGTSMAAPFAAGLAALIKSQNPAWQNWQIMQQMINTTDYTGLSGMGSGRINALSALTAASQFANISSPVQNTNVFGSIQIIGTATWEGAGHYTIATGEGAAPLSYTEFIDSSTKVVNGLLGSWDTTGLSGPYTIRLRVNDLPTVESTRVVNVGGGRLKIVGDSVGGPNPYNPRGGQNYVIYYKLTKPAEVRLSLYDMNGSLVYQTVFNEGDEGGRSGDNAVEWNGKTAYNEYPSNGIYFYQLVSDGVLLDKGKILIYQ